MIIFTLNHKLRAALIEAENFVVEIEAIHDELHPMNQAIAALNVHLEVGIEVDVAIWPLDSSRSYGGRTTSERIRSVLISILEDVRSVVGQACTKRETTAIIRRTDVPGVRGGAREPWVVGTVKEPGGSRIGVAVICRDTETTEQSWEKRQMLQVGDFKPSHPSAAGVDGLRHVVKARRSPRNRRLIVGDLDRFRYDWVAEVLIEKPCRDESERLERMLQEHVEVVSGFRFEIGISQGSGVDATTRREARCLGNVLRIRTRQTTTVDKTEVCVTGDGDACGDARKHLKIRTAEFAC